MNFILPPRLSFKTPKTKEKNPHMFEHVGDGGEHVGDEELGDHQHKHHVRLVLLPVVVKLLFKNSSQTIKYCCLIGLIRGKTTYNCSLFIG